jgi:hypothetical protein
MSTTTQQTSYAPTSNRAYRALARAERALRSHDYAQMVISITIARECARELRAAHAREHILSECDRITRS